MEKGSSFEMGENIFEQNLFKTNYECISKEEENNEIINVSSGEGLNSEIENPISISSDDCSPESNQQLNESHPFEEEKKAKLQVEEREFHSPSPYFESNHEQQMKSPEISKSSNIDCSNFEEINAKIQLEGVTSYPQATGEVIEISSSEEINGSENMVIEKESQLVVDSKENMIKKKHKELESKEKGVLVSEANNGIELDEDKGVMDSSEEGEEKLKEEEKENNNNNNVWGEGEEGMVEIEGMDLDIKNIESIKLLGDIQEVNKGIEELRIKRIQREAAKQNKDSNQNPLSLSLSLSPSASASAEAGIGEAIIKEQNMMDNFNRAAQNESNNNMNNMREEEGKEDCLIQNQMESDLQDAFLLHSERHRIPHQNSLLSRFPNTSSIKLLCV